MSRLVITKDKILNVFHNKKYRSYANYIILVTDYDVIFARASGELISIKDGFSEYYDEKVHFCGKYRYPDNDKIPHYRHRHSHHFWWNLPEKLNPIYNYGTAKDCNSDTINEIIRDYSKVQEDQKMLHFHVTDLILRHQ